MTRLVGAVILLLGTVACETQGGTDGPRSAGSPPANDMSTVTRDGEAASEVPAVSTRSGGTSERPTPERLPDTVVLSAGPPRHAGMAPLIPELTIGLEDGAPEYLFTRILDVHPLRDGSILVLDDRQRGRGDAIVRQFGTDGRYVRHLGRLGQGPGEYRAPSAVAQLPDGRILLHDVERVNVYTEDGESVDTWRMVGYQGTGGGVAKMRTHPDGTVHLPFQRRIALETPGEFDFDYPVLRLRDDGAIIDTLMQPELPDVARQVTVSSDRMRITVPQHYSPYSIARFSRLGYWVTGVSTRYAIDLLSPRSGTVWRPGDPVFSIHRDVQPVPVPSAERAERKSAAAARIVGSGGRSGDVLDEPPFKPFFRDITLGEDGRVWVLLHTPSERFSPPPCPTPGLTGCVTEGRPPPAGWREPGVYDVFERNGTYLGQVGPVPEDVFPMWMHGDTVWAMVRDENRVEFLTRFRVAWERSTID